MQIARAGRTWARFTLQKISPRGLAVQRPVTQGLGCILQLGRSNRILADPGPRSVSGCPHHTQPCTPVDQTPPSCLPTRPPPPGFASSPITSPLRRLCCLRETISDVTGGGVTYSCIHLSVTSPASHPKTHNVRTPPPHTHTHTLLRLRSKI